MHKDESATKLIWQLGQQYGIDPFYFDGLGVERQVSVPHLQQVLASMGVKASSKKEILASLAHADFRTWTQVIDAVVVRYPSDAPFMLALSLPLGSSSLEKVSLVIQVTDEKGRSRRLSIPGSRVKVISE